mmetsp:Transcript_5299/g.13241  ORF Transcript_5299/g.13241 Transcript_5299/m.13241 type:complete len:205 (+) Transcript_5299:268-882(+)
MHSSVAAHSQYLLGEKTREWMISPASSEYRRLPSLRSHSIAVPSFPPDAQRLPSGDTHTVLRYPVCPMRSLRSLQFVSAQTFTRRSHPHETMRGTDWDGLKRTQDTHSEWPSASVPMVYLHSPRVFQSLMVLSRDPLTIWRLSTLNATDRTSFECPTKRRVVRPLLISHRRRVPSQLPDSANCPSLLMTTSDTKWECPRRARWA